MNDILAKIDTILDDYFKNDKRVLEEESESMCVPIESGGVHFMSFSFDKKLNSEDYPNGLFPFFSKEKKARSMCDYIIFSGKERGLYVLLIELKAGGNSVMNQLKAGKALVDFIVATLNRVYDIRITPTVRLVAIRNSHITNKRPTKIRAVEYDENGFYTFEGGRFFLREFLK